MAVTSSGQIKITDIVTEFGGTAPHALSEYYDAAAGIPASGIITVSDFYGASAALSLTVTSSQLNFDLYDALIAAGHSSSTISGVAIFNLTINSGVTMKGSNTQGNNSRLGDYTYNTSYSVTDHGDTAAGAFGTPKVPMGASSSQRAGTSVGGVVIEGLPNGCTINITNAGTIEPGAGSGGHGPHNNHGPWHGHYQHCGGGTGGAGITIIDVDSATVNLTNSGTVRSGGGGGGGGGWGAGHSSCCPKWGGDGQGHNRSNQGGAGGSHGGNAGGSGGTWGNGGSTVNSQGGLGGTIFELRSCSSTTVNLTNTGTTTGTTSRSTSSWRA